MAQADEIWGWWMFFVYLWLWWNLCIWLWVLSGWLHETLDDWRHPERQRRKREQRKVVGLDTQLRRSFARTKKLPRVFPTTPETEEFKPEHGS